MIPKKNKETQSQVESGNKKRSTIKIYEYNGKPKKKKFLLLFEYVVVSKNTTFKEKWHEKTLKDH